MQIPKDSEDIADLKRQALGLTLRNSKADHLRHRTLPFSPRMLLFPHAEDAQFADGYAQAVTLAW